MINFLLLILALLLSAIMLPLGFCYALVRALFGAASNYFYSIAISVDQLGNTVMATLFNDILIKSKVIPFGNPDETISSVLGKNKGIDNLTWLGRRLSWFLNTIDKNHVEESIEKHLIEENE